MRLLIVPARCRLSGSGSERSRRLRRTSRRPAHPAVDRALDLGFVRGRVEHLRVHGQERRRPAADLTAALPARAAVAAQPDPPAAVEEVEPISAGPGEEAGALLSLTPRPAGVRRDEEAARAGRNEHMGRRGIHDEVDEWFRRTPDPPASARVVTDHHLPARCVVAHHATTLHTEYVEVDPAE